MNDATLSTPCCAGPDAAGQTLSAACDCVVVGDHLEIRDLSICYDGRAVVERVSLRVPRNSITALIGPSGCGKSSVLYCLNGLSSLIPCCAATGSVRFSWLDDARVMANPTLLRRHVGMLFQRPNPFPFSIRKNMTFALRQHGVRDRHEVAARVESALREVGLWDEVCDRLDAPALALSGGQQQRLCLARALVLDPSVLLMDEPCSALDPMATQTIEDLIRRLAERRTIVLVTHSLAQARRLADQVALLWKFDGGVARLVEAGAADDVFMRPRHALTQAYLRFA